MRSVSLLVIASLISGSVYGNDVIEDITEVTTNGADELDLETSAETVDVNPCVLPPDPGPCTNPSLQYYYSSETQKCRQFIYGGCEGNSNRFRSEAVCNSTCFATKNLIDESQVLVKADDEQDFATLGSENLRLWNGTGQTSFTFSKGNPLIQLNREILKGFQLRNTREISFEFRTSDPKGLFLFHTLNSRPNEEVKYELYVILEGGELKIIHVFGADETTLLVGKALNRDIWHKVRIVIDPASAVLEAAVDDIVASTVCGSLKRRPSYSVSEDVDSIMFIGGMDIVQDGMESSYLFEHFVGCLRNIRLRGGPSESELAEVNPLTTGFFRDIKEGCIDSCLGENNCRNGGRCINLYDRTVCDCFGTKYEGDHCDHDVPTVLTLRGYSYLSYRIYDWKDRVHSQSNRISMKFKSHVGDSILFYAGGTFPETNHIAVTLLRNGSLYIEIDFGNNPQGIVLGERLTNGAWHNLTAIHEGRTVKFLLNNRLSGSITVSGDKYHLRFDPHIYVGGDRKPIGPGLLSTNNFVGCLSDVYVNHINILYGLRSGRPQAIYHGILTPELQVCEEVKDIPVTFPFAESEIEIDEAVIDNLIDLRLDFKTSQTVAVLAHGGVTMDIGTSGYWEVRLVRGELQFMIIPEAMNETDFYVLARTGRRLADGSWHMLKLEYKNNELSLNVDFRYKEKVMHDRVVGISSTLVIGTSLADPHLGVVGCMRKISINGEEQDPRLLVNGKVREVSLDSCQLVDPCKRPNACEHGGRCMVDDGRVVCDCTGTGYTGKNCHFALYKRTCEELALLGYHKSGVYEIDIDGNGPHPPAHVRCEFEPSGARKTVVEHNLPTDMEIRSRRVGNVQIDLTYREFTPDMLQSLVSQSLQCQQHIRYDCYKAPLELHSFTWFRSSSGAILDYLGSTKPGRCPCATGQQCVHPSLFCNCDGDENKWRLDEGYLTRPEELGITQIFALQPKKLHPAADGRITLGPLECVEANTQQYVVTFKSADSYMEVPGWRTGDLAFSFRTSSEQGILLYQPMLHPKHPYFRVILVNDHELTLEFSINGEPRSVTVKSTRDLNSGEWQQVWIDYNEYHVRFTVNQESILLDLKDGEEFGPFEATLYIGGAPEEMLQASNHSEGLIGCYRGLVMNNEVVNLYAYMNARFPDMIQKHCLPSCDPNPCKNGATCVEFWGSYKCICQNPLAHFGHNCETNINKNALTFRSHGAFVEANATSKSDAEKFGLFRFFSDDILLNVRTFDTKSLIFYAYDYMNNFVQLHIDRERRIVFTFNSEYEIKQVNVSLEGVNAGGAVQILIDREPDSTTLLVNDVSSSVATPLQLITKYKRNPWKNSQLETVRPPRPVRRPEEFYQVFLGGVDAEYMDTALPGFVGCLRGLKLGPQVIDLMSSQSHDLARDVSLHGVIPGCSMLCDKHPCQNGGVCSEDFITNSFTCDCELTSYFGDTCTEEKGANFGGDSYIFAKHTAVELSSVRVQFAFSTTAVRNLAQALLLIQTENDNTKYLLVTLTHLGYLRIEEDRGDGVVFGAEVKSINFLNGARHSIFYKRKGSSAHLMVDRSDIPIRPLATSIHINMLADVTDVNAIHVGGIKHTSDPRFSDYDKFDGCLSNVYIELDGEEIQPLLIYLGYEKDHDAVTSHDPAGIEEEARCAAFSVNPPGVSEQTSDSGNETYVVDWNPKPPKISPYRENVLYDKMIIDTAGMNRLLVGIGVVFLVMIIFISLYMWRIDRKHKKRKYEEDESPLIPPPTLTSKQPAKPSLKPTTKDSGVTARLPSAPPRNSPSKPVEDLIQLIDTPQLGRSNPALTKAADEGQEQLLIITSEERSGREELVKQGRPEPEGEDSPSEPINDVSPANGTVQNGLIETSLRDETLLPGHQLVRGDENTAESLEVCHDLQPEPIGYAVEITQSTENLLGDPEDQQEYLEEVNVMAQSFGADSGIDQDDSPQQTLISQDATEYPELEPVAELADFDDDASLTEATRLFPPILEEEEEIHIDSDEPDDCQTPGSSSMHSSEPSLNEEVGHLEVVDNSHPADTAKESLKPLRRQHSLPTSGVDIHPIYLSDDCRTFTNPISYLGGPRIKKPRPVSQESMVSIDE